MLTRADTASERASDGPRALPVAIGHEPGACVCSNDDRVCVCVWPTDDAVAAAAAASNAQSKHS